MDNTIRRLCIGADPKSQFVYFVGGEHKLYIDNKPRVVVVESIQATEKHYLINVNTGGEIQLWKKIAKNEFITEEFLLD